MTTDFYYIFQGDALLISLKTGTPTVPTNLDFSVAPAPKFLVYEDRQCHHYLIDADDTTGLSFPDDFHFNPMTRMRDYYGLDVYTMAIRCYQLHNWRRKHLFCGVCGTKFTAMRPDRSLKCHQCDNVLYPQTSNAIIVAILKDNKILLAHNQNFSAGLYSLVAGFVEMGESFEDAVHREVYEEVGIRVKNIRYFDNQEWPYPNSTMIGFFADYDSGEIQVDGTEILDARWYTPDTFPVLPSKASIARRLIETYRDSFQG